LAEGGVEGYLADKSPEGATLFRAFQRLVEACGPSEPSVAQTVVYFKRNRIFCGGFVRGKRLEIVVDLLREADHPCLIGSFSSTKRVVSHRLRITEPTQLDEKLAALLAEAYSDVGPGTR
jgi:hypothetical protein